MASSTLKPAHRTTSAPRPTTRIAWQGVRFTLPGEWSLTGLSMNPAEGYLKVDSDDGMIAQVRWHDPAAERAATVAGMLLNRFRPYAAAEEPDLAGILDRFLGAAQSQARKDRSSFERRIKPQRDEEDRVSRSFSWSGAAIGQGKIWSCRSCGRVVVAQVSGGRRSPVQAAASEMFSEFACHPDGERTEWALYGLAAAVPSRFRLVEQKTLTGNLRLVFRCGAERIVIERWGLAGVVRKRFTLDEWFARSCRLDGRLPRTDARAHGHPARQAAGRITSISGLARAVWDSGRRRPAMVYEGRAWECPETNHLFAIQAWRARSAEPLLEELVERCACHRG